MGKGGGQGHLTCKCSSVVKRPLKETKNRSFKTGETEIHSPVRFLARTNFSALKDPKCNESHDEKNRSEQTRFEREGGVKVFMVKRTIHVRTKEILLCKSGKTTGTLLHRTPSSRLLPSAYGLSHPPISTIFVT